MKQITAFIAGCVFIATLIAPGAQAAQTTGATLYVGPATGTFTVGSTFTVSFYVNTGNQFINVVDADILFPPDKLQVVSPSTGASFINVWAIQPSYSNTEGTMSFRGAVPSPGVNTSAGLISTVTFRVKSIGTATVRFAGGSKVLLNDGLGTNILQQQQSGIFTLTLPPPSGPTVISPTHPDQTQWYSTNDVQFSWAGDGSDGYSYMISADPSDMPDNIGEGIKGGITYRDLANGRHYFHIKALRDGVWGGTTHYALNIDADPPAEFPIELLPSGRTAQHQPVIKFFTTDGDSGMDRYEIKIISLGQYGTPPDPEKVETPPFYIEAQSPFIPGPLEFGRYDVFVRAYDAAGNYREVNRRLEIVPTLFEIIQGQGIQFSNAFFIPWPVFWALALLLVIILGIIARRLHWWHRNADAARADGVLPADVSEKLAQLKEYQEKYGKAVSVLVLMVVLLGSFAQSVRAQSPVEVFAPPVITTVSKDIFSDEIFYVGGNTAEPNAEIILYVQRMQDGQTTSHRLAADNRGAWFYRHNSFIQPGNYLLWAQTQREEEVSPPSPQVMMTVAAHAIQVGSSRFTYEAIYFIAMLLLAAVVIILSIAIWYHYHHGKRKHAKFLEEKAKIEESIRRGFALLRRDIEEEVALVRAATAGGGSLAPEQKRREEQLLRDLEAVRRHIGEEVWELQKLEQE